MDFERYVMEVIRVTGTDHTGLEPNHLGVQMVLTKISAYFMDDAPDKKLANAKSG